MNEIIVTDRPTYCPEARRRASNDALPTGWQGYGGSANAMEKRPRPTRASRANRGGQFFPCTTDCVRYPILTTSIPTSPPTTWLSYFTLSYFTLSGSHSVGCSVQYPSPSSQLAKPATSPF